MEVAKGMVEDDGKILVYQFPAWANEREVELDFIMVQDRNALSQKPLCPKR